MTAADLIAILRAVATIPIAWSLAIDARPAALALFAVAAGSDALDGWLARRAGLTSARGALLDPLADKVLVVGTLAALAAIGTGWPVTVVAVLAGAREAVVAVLRIRAHTRGRTLGADRLAKLKTGAEMAGVALIIVGTRPWAVLGAGLVGLALVAGLFTLPRYVRAARA